MEKKTVSRSELLSHLTLLFHVSEDGTTATLGLLRVFEILTPMVGAVYRLWGQYIITPEERHAQHELFDRFEQACKEHKCAYERGRSGDSLTKQQFTCLLEVLCDAGSKGQVGIPLGVYYDNYQEKLKPKTLAFAKPIWERYAHNLIRSWFSDECPELAAQEAKLSLKPCCAWHMYVPNVVRGLKCPEFPFPGTASDDYPRLCEILKKRMSSDESVCV